MNLFRSLVGGAVGFALGGPVGAILGASIAYQLGDKDQFKSGISILIPQKSSKMQMAFFAASFFRHGACCQNGRTRHAHKRFRLPNSIMSDLNLNSRYCAIPRFIFFNKAKNLIFNWMHVLAQFYQECPAKPNPDAAVFIHSIANRCC